jgi:hypothetical protein
MQLRYDDDFVEAAVFLCASGRRCGAPALQIRRFHAEREKCYSLADPDERNTAFFKVHLGWFREWGLDQLLTGLLNEYPLLPGALNVLAFRQARSRNEEGAEMYVSETGVRSAMAALRMDRLERDETLLRFLRHEFMHLHDMVDPAFGYSPQICLSSRNETQQRITRERYRLLWDITIDGRLTRAGRETVTRQEQHQALFERAFSFWPAEKRRLVFESHWSGLAPRHESILALAADPRDLSHAQEPLPGGSCPLCHFPTFEWAEMKPLAQATITILRTQFTHWSPDQGACKRCVEIYEMAGQHAWPATIAGYIDAHK